MLSFLAARMVDMLSRGTIAKIFFRENENRMVFFLNTRKILTSILVKLLSTTEFWHIFDASTSFKLLSSSNLLILSGLCTRKRTWSIIFVFLSREEATRQWSKRESEWKRVRLAREKLMKAVSDVIVLHAERRVKTIGFLTAQW